MTVKRSQRKVLKEDNLNSKLPVLTRASAESSFDISSEGNSLIDPLECRNFVKPIDFRNEIESCVEPLKKALSHCQPCECLFFLENEPLKESEAIYTAEEAYECSSEASSAFVSVMELDDSECMKMVEAVKKKEFRQPNSLALPFKDEYLTVKSIKDKLSSEDSDSLPSSVILTKEDADNRYARPGWITGLHDPIGLGAYEWEKLVKSVLGQGRYGRKSSREPFFRFELPINLEQLCDVSPLVYLEKYCKISDRRIALYQKEFSKHKEPKGSFISKSNLFKALNNIMVGTLSNGQFADICDILEIGESGLLTMQSFFGICAVTERLFFSKNLTSTSEESFEIQKGYIELADFMNLNYKLNNIHVSPNVAKLIRSL